MCRQAGRGQQVAFEELRRRHVQPAWRLAQTLIAGGDDADRATQQAFIQVIRAGSRREVTTEPFRTRLLAAVYRHAVEDRQPTARPAMGRDRPSHGHDDGTPSVGPENQRLGHALAALPERWRAALWLTDVERMPLNEVAAVIGTSSPAAAQLVTRARSGLAQRFRQAGPHGNLPDVPAALRAGCRTLPAESNARALARWKRAQSGHRHLVVRSRDWWSERTRRQLTAGAAALLALGLIGLGVIDQGAFGGSSPGGAVAAPLASHQFTGPPGASLELAGLLLDGPGGLAPFGANPLTSGLGALDASGSSLAPGPAGGAGSGGAAPGPAGGSSSGGSPAGAGSILPPGLPSTPITPLSGNVSAGGVTAGVNVGGCTGAHVGPLPVGCQPTTTPPPHTGVTVTVPNQSPVTTPPVTLPPVTAPPLSLPSVPAPHLPVPTTRA